MYEVKSASSRPPATRDRTTGQWRTFENVRNLPCQIKRVLNTGVGTESIGGRVTMDRIPEAEHVTLSILLRPDVVDEPFADVEDFDIDGVIADDLFDALHPMLLSRRDVCFVPRHWEHNEHPLMPRLHHSGKTDPGKVGMAHVMLVAPVQITLPVCDVLAQVCLDQHIPRQPSARILPQR